MKRILTLSLWLLAGLPATAQDTLTLARCRELALKHNKEMQAALHQTDYARYTAKSLWANFFPNFTLEGTGLYSNMDGSFGVAGGNLPTFLPDATGQPMPNGGFAYFPGVDLHYKVGAVFMGGLSLEQPLYMGGKLRAAYRMGQLGQRMAQAQATLTTTEVILQTDEAYANVVKARQMQEVAQAYHALLEELLKNVQSARRHGLKTKNDELKVQVKLNESELHIRRAENALRLATMNLCHCIGRPLLTPLHTTSALPDVETSETLQTSDVSRRPEYILLEHKVEMARQQVNIERSGLLPQIGLKGTYNYLHGMEMNHETLFDQPAFAVMLNVKVPLFHFGERANKVRAAKAQLAQTRLAREDLQEKMLLELTQAAHNLDEALLECRIATRSLEQADENRRVSRSHYDAGMETLSDLLEAQALWQQAFQTQIDSRYRLYLKQIAYRKAAGLLTEAVFN